MTNMDRTKNNKPTRLNTRIWVNNRVGLLTDRHQLNYFSAVCDAIQFAFRDLRSVVGNGESETLSTSTIRL
jgi:hypothetical protein